MHFTRSQIEFYHQNGYLPGPRVLDDSLLDRLQRRFDDIMAGHTDFPSALRSAPPSDQKGALRAVKAVNVFRHDSVFAEVLRLPAIGELAHDLLMGPVRVWQDQAITKVPHDLTTGLAWHQDFVYNDQIGPPEWCTCWIALDDAIIDNGCMYVIPGSHRWPIAYSREEVDGDDMDWLLRHPQIPLEADRTPVACEVKAGYCHFHHCKTVHGSYGNRTNKPRRSYTPILIPGNTIRVGDDWNPGRHASLGNIPYGGIVQGPEFPELPALDSGSPARRDQKERVSP